MGRAWAEPGTDDVLAAGDEPGDVTTAELEQAMHLRLAGVMPAGSRRVDRAMLASAALALGILLGRVFEHVALPVWVDAAAVCLVLALAATIVHRPLVRNAALVLVVVLLGAARSITQQTRVTADDLAGRIGSEPLNLTLRGVAMTAPEHRARVAGSLARFDYRPPATYFQMRVQAVVNDTGDESAVSGQVLVRVDEAMTPFRAGDGVTLTGRITPFRPPVNPGEFDYARHARALQQAGMIIVPDRRLIDITPHARWAMLEVLSGWRADIQRQAGGWLLADLPDDRALGDRAALLSALLLGERERQFEQIDETFRRVGLAHLLAISGLHLGILVGLVLLLARLGGGVRPWHGWMIIAAIIVYLAVVQVRLPLTRAAIMTMAGALGLALGRPMRIGGLIALSAAGILLWRPDQLFSPGFQLSFGVVLALAHLAPRARVRWFGVANAQATTVGEITGEWVKTTLAASVVAWCVATPIVMHHFAIISPLAIVLSVLLLPAIALLLALGFCKLLTAPLWPSIALLLGVPLSTLADMTLSLVRGADTMPLSSINVSPPGAVWTLACVVVMIVWLRIGWRHRRAVQLGMTGVVAWFFVPAGVFGIESALRIDMLSVGDGTCIVVRNGGQCVVFDAGSSTNLNAGEASILPAMRALGVRHVDALMISHANIDHYSAVLELADAFAIREVFITQQFADAARAAPQGPLAFVLDELTNRRVVLRIVSNGYERRFGSGTWTWLHPPGEAQFARVNNSSMIVRVDIPTDDGVRTLLLTGDSQMRAIAMLLQTHGPMHADVMELPHHGSFNEAAVALVQTIEPRVLLQSTGRTRFENDLWKDVLAEDTQRLITARDGACWVEVGRDGMITSGVFAVEHQREAD